MANTKFKLFYNNQPIVIKYKNASGKLALLFARELNKLHISNSKEYAAVYGIILSKYINPEETNSEMAAMQALQKAFVAGDISADQIKEFTQNQNSTEEDLIHDYEIYINLFKEIVDFSELNPTNKELLSSEWNSEFFMEQNVGGIKAEVFRFRQLNLQ